VALEGQLGAIGFALCVAMQDNLGDLTPIGAISGSSGGFCMGGLATMAYGTESLPGASGEWMTAALSPEGRVTSRLKTM
jgi:hypothetical protein